MAKKGRPVCENPRSVRCIFRLTDSESSRLDDICKMSGMGRSDVMRTALERMFEEESMKCK